MKCKCRTEASQVVLLFNNRCGALHFPLLESVQIEEGPCQKLTARFRGEIFTKPGTQRWYEKGRKREGGGESEIRSDSTQKCMWEHIIKKRGVSVWVRTLWSELIATGRFAASEDSTESVPASFNTFLCLSHFLSFFICLRTILQSFLCTVRPD